MSERVSPSREYFLNTPLAQEFWEKWGKLEKGNPDRQIPRQHLEDGLVFLQSYMVLDDFNPPSEVPVN